MTSDIVHLGLGWIGEHAGGLERYQDGLCVAQARAGRNVTAWVQCDKQVVFAKNYHLIRYGSPRDRGFVKLLALNRLAKQSLSSSGLVVATHHASVSTGLVGALRKLPHVVHFHGPWADEAAFEGVSACKTLVQRHAERRVYRSADRIITLSVAFADLLADRYGINREKIAVIPGGIDSKLADPMILREEAREILGWPKDRRIILTIRRLIKRVGIDVLIDAIAGLVKRHPDILLLIGGTGEMNGSLMSLIESRGLGGHVRLLGFIPEDTIRFAYAAADFSVVPTQALEGFGLVTIESLAAGTPVIVTPVGGLLEIVGPLSDSLVLKGAGVSHIRDGLDAILSGLVALPSGDDCKQYVRQNYDWSLIAPQTLRVYDACRK